MLNTMLVPVDGSDFADRAVSNAVIVARAEVPRAVLKRVLPRRAPGSASDELSTIQANLSSQPTATLPVPTGLA